MEWIITAGISGISGYLLVRHVVSTFRGTGKKGECGGNCSACASCKLMPGSSGKN